MALDLAAAGSRMVAEARRSVVQVRSGGRGAGAGVVWPGDGLVLTNDHVVPRGRWAGRRRGERQGERRDGNPRVILHDDRTFGAEVVRRDPRLDLALLRVVDGSGGLPPAVVVGDSGALRVGELVFAIGHPWGRPGAVSAGVVSGLGPFRGPGGRNGYVRSDVALAPGNSGGPLLNARGEVVGINAMISGGMALSIPSKAANAWTARVEGANERPRLGVGVVPAFGPGQTGLVIAAVERGGPADRAGLLVGDVLLGVGDRTVGDVASLLDTLTSAGGAVGLRFTRGGRISTVEVDLAEPDPECAA